ncbi:hypothetical protein QJQ45_012003 [Haematococcus lacustris]|nr:hypothetical protein QJQ45_012003 [Haematococcus lacustris]
MSVAGEQQPIGNQRLAPVQTTRAVVAAMRRSPALPIPRVLQSPVIGLAGASALQPQRKKRKAENTTTAATDGGSTDSPRSRPVSQWVEAQWEQRAGAQVACKHCPDYHSSVALAAPKLDSNLSTAVARLQQQHAAEQEQQQEVLDIQTEFNEFFMRFLVDNNLPLHLVENETTKAFFNKFIPHLKLPSRYELSGSLLIALYITVMMDVKQRVAEAPFVALTMDGWAKSLGVAHLLGVCAVLAGRVSVFLDVINTAGHSATSELMLIEMLGVIEKHDLAGKVCAVVTDTPTPMRKLWRLLEERHPRMLCVGCHAHIINLYFTTLDPNFRDKHDTLTTDQLRAAEDLAARLASADGRGSDSAADKARYEFNTWCGGDYMTRMKLTPRFFSPLLLRDVVRWWGWYGKQTPVLMEVAQRVFCTPATSAGVERLFSVFKMLWSDKRNRLLMGRMWAMAYVFFNTRALKRDDQPFAPTAAEEEQWEEWMASQPVGAA